MTRRRRGPGGRLEGARVYLSGPMDFVASREDEMKFGWRNRVGQFLRAAGVTVFDPWDKPGVRGFGSFGRESPKSQELIRKWWTYDPGPKGQRIRGKCAHEFYESMQVDLRMVDTSDFIIAFCPTTVYSVGTVHEIVMARSQRKPVMFVTPHLELDELDELRTHLTKDRKGAQLLKALEAKLPLKANPDALPSAWYMSLLSGECFFDGFGFEPYRKRFGWKLGPLDEAECEHKVRRPLLPQLLKITRRRPMRYSPTARKMVADNDWLIWDLKNEKA